MAVSASFMASRLVESSLSLETSGLVFLRKLSPSAPMQETSLVRVASRRATIHHAETKMRRVTK
jgi:hypothetical protein